MPRVGFCGPSPSPHKEAGQDLLGTNPRARGRRVRRLPGWEQLAWNFGETFCSRGAAATCLGWLLTDSQTHSVLGNPKVGRKGGPDGPTPHSPDP